MPIKSRSIYFSIALLLNGILHPLFIHPASAGSLLQISSEQPSFWLWDLMGRLHPLAVHFPVSLILVAAVLELFTIKKYHSTLRPGINILIWMGVISAAITALFGWLLSIQGEYGDEGISIHQWTGFSGAFLSGLTLVAMIRIQRKINTRRVKFYRTMLFFTTVSISVAGHFGASITHGSDYLSAGMPWSENYQNQKIINVDFAALKNDTTKLTPDQERELNVQVKSIFAHSCNKCHGPEKVKGELRLDRKDMAFRGGESGAVIIPGDPKESELFRRITLPHSDEDAMPSKGKRLSEKEVGLIGYWIQKGAPWPDNDEQMLFRVAKLEPRNPILPIALDGLQHPIDLWVNEYFKEDQFNWPALVDDRTYLRRIYLDIVGLLPTPEETDAFSADKRTDKRAILARELLNRNEDYAINWLSFWNDLLRNDYTGTGYITKGRFAITDWLYKSLKANKPYNTFVKELINPGEKSKGFIKGIEWRGVINSSQRVEMQAAQNVAQVFYGVNIKCASCHNSFVNDWKLDDAYGFANIFADSSLEINRCDKPTGNFTVSKMLYKELGSIDNDAPVKVKRQQLAVNTVKPENGRVYRTLVNRIWAQLMARGLVEPVDEMDNQPWSQDLLDWMAYNFEQNNSDIKELIFLITTSRTYQLPSVGVKDPAVLVSNDYQFRGRTRKRMSAEQFSDAVSSIASPLFSDSLVRYNPFGKRKAKLINQPFGRASLVENNPFLTALGRPNRETVSTGRDSQANLLMALELTNGDRFNAALKEGAENWKKEFAEPDLIVRQLYQRALGRDPNAEELTYAMNLLGAEPETENIQDLFWAVMMLPEFQIVE